MTRCTFAGEEQSKLFAQKAVSTIGVILLTAADEQEPARPFFPVKTVLAAILRLAGQSTQKNLERLWGQASGTYAILLLADNAQPSCISCSFWPRHPEEAGATVGSGKLHRVLYQPFLGL